MIEHKTAKMVIAIFLVAVALFYLWQNYSHGPKSTAIVPPRAKLSTAIWDSACARGDTLSTGRYLGGCYICEKAKDRLTPIVDTIQVITIQRISETAVNVHMDGEDRQYEWCVKTICKGEVK